jgi:hypothetical protein
MKQIIRMICNRNMMGTKKWKRKTNRKRFLQAAVARLNLIQRRKMTALKKMIIEEKTHFY